MGKFETLRAVAAPLDRDNVDTDVIYPGKYLSTVAKSGFGEIAFESLRFKGDGSPDPDCVFHKPPFDGAQILLAGHNFGCGSSREHAVWAIRDLGFRCLIAKSFGDTFYYNCLANGLLALALAEPDVDRLIAQADQGEILVDLENQRVEGADGQIYAFEIDSFQKDCLLRELDAIALTLEDEDRISSFEQSQRAQQPWLYPSSSEAGGSI
jgi:3-isopropylmalate/(R)-2-methylmalate dehydratase small subunit